MRLSRRTRRSRLRPWLLSYFMLLVLFLLILPIALLNNSPPYELPPSPQIRILNTAGEVEMVDIEVFLVGVVAAEMPASFETEALKAQAAAARTYILHAMGGGRHEEATVCTNSAHCQAYLSLEEMQERWGKDFHTYYEKIKQVVGETYGMVITYGAVPIDALYHSTCGGHTEDAGSYWDKPVPYLLGVPCEWDAESQRYRNREVFTLSAAAKRLGISVTELTGMKITALTGTGRVKNITVGSKSFSGKGVRELLGLFSSAFTFDIEGENIVFLSSGSGHGAGLCQYGANGMAKAGYNWQEIINHYYTGITLQKYYEDKTAPVGQPDS